MFEAFVPKEYRSLFEYISPAAFKVIKWKEVLSAFSQITRNLGDGSGKKALIKELRSRLPEEIEIAQEPSKPTTLEGQDNGPKILELYFAQFFNRKGIFIDFREQFFGTNDQALIFSPSNVRYQFSESFRLGMIQIYEGYYTDQSEVLKKGLRQSGLLPMDAADGRAKELIDLLFSHFGNANDDSATQSFSLRQFKSSFHDLFVYLKKHRTELPGDFLLLGMYLVSLYMTLESIGAEVRVKDSFKNAWAVNQR